MDYPSEAGILKIYSALYLKKRESAEKKEEVFDMATRQSVKYLLGSFVAALAVIWHAMVIRQQ